MIVQDVRDPVEGYSFTKPMINVVRSTDLDRVSCPENQRNFLNPKRQHRRNNNRRTLEAGTAWTPIVDPDNPQKCSGLAGVSVPVAGRARHGAGLVGDALPYPCSRSRSSSRKGSRFSEGRQIPVVRDLV